jgi:hypothetical protein
VSVARTLWRALVTLAVLLGLGAAAALVFAPEVLAPVRDTLAPVYDAIESTEPDQLLLVGMGLTAAVAALVFVIGRVSGDDADPVLVAEDRRPPESTSVDPATVSGYLADEAVRRVESLDDAREEREPLRETAVEALRTAGESPERARERIDRGAWTDDDLAAGFLGEAAPVPLLARLRGWLDGAAEGRRRLVRSIDAVDALASSPERVVRRPIEEGTDE